MEKVIGWKKIVFKDKMTMWDRQKVAIERKKYDQTKDEFELCFNLFPIICISIDDQPLSDQEKLTYIKSIDDMEAFSEISESLAEIRIQIANEVEKKKKNIDMNSKSEVKPEK